MTDGTKISGYVTADEHGQPKHVNDEDCCNGYQSPGRTLLFILRHGTTELNEDNKFRGWIDVSLDEKGRQDAIEAADFLRDKGISMVYCSDMSRAIETAKIVCEKLGLDEPTPDFRLRPWHVGELAGEDKDANKPTLEYHIDHPDEAIEGGESLEEFGQRTQEAFEYYLEEARHQGIKLIICHTSNVVQAENLVKGEGSEGRPESKDSVLPGGVIVITEMKDKLSTKPLLKEDGETQYAS